MKKIINLLGWSVKQIIAGIVGLIGVLVAIGWAITIMYMTAYLWLGHVICAKTKNRTHKGQLNKLYTELAQSLNSMARTIRWFRV